MLTSANGAARPDPEVLEKARRRRFTAEYKASVLRDYEATPKGERGAFLRREGLYSSHINKWREERESRALQALAPQRRGPKPKPQPDPEVLALRKEVARLEHQLQRAQKVIEVQKKISEILGVEQNLPDDLKEEN
jgi:transposase-like protein